MSPSIRFGAVHMLIACIAAVLGVQVASCASVRAEENKAYRLTFSLPEGTLLHYKSYNQLGQSYGGTDVSMNQTSRVDMAWGDKADSMGVSRVDIKYIEVKSSLVSGGQIREWEPPIKLEGATIRVFVSPTGEVVRFEPGRNVPGLQNPEDLREIIDAWFVRFPDTTVTIGQSWSREIVKGKRDEGEPDAIGRLVCTLKKVEKKGSLEVAFIEGKMTLKLHQDTPAGILVGEGKAERKAQVVVEGGYIIELKETIEIEGEVIAKDPLTDKETRRETAVTQYYERKLQQ